MEVPLNTNSYDFFNRSLKMLASAVVLLITNSTVLAQNDPLHVERPDAVYEIVLTNRSIERRVSSWYHGLYGKSKSYTDETWASEQRHFLEETAAAGIDGPFAPTSLNRFGEARIDELYETCGMKFPFYIHSGPYSQRAKEAGATFVFSMTYASGERGSVACWDSRYMEIANAGTEKRLKEHGKKPWLSCVIGKDEPLNWAGTARYPANVDMVNKALKKKYGITIELTALDTTKAYYEWPTDPAILNKPHHEVALLRIGVWRWLNEQLYEAARREFELVHKYAPGVEYFAYNRNAINIFDFINKDVRNSLDRLDQSLLYEVTDGFSADPYPTGNLHRDRESRALYHVGFISKFITDLAAGKPTTIIMQGFKFTGVLPTTTNLREWTSQAAKAGVTHLEWYTSGNPRSSWPEVYKEILRLSRLWKDLPALDIPEQSDIAVLFSADSRNATNDAGMHAHYMLHVLLGENLGAWYTFIGENQVRRGQQSLDNAKLIIAPQLSYVSREFAQKFIDCVEKGATLVVLDPDALTHDIETGSLASLRKRLMGTPLGKKRDASQLIPTQNGKKRFKGIEYLLLEPGNTGRNTAASEYGGVLARTLKIPKNAQVLFEYGDRTPAVFSRKLGKGEVIVFSTMPFGDSELALRPFGWDILFASLCDELNIQRDLPIWRFLLPETGGEVATYELLSK